MGEIRRIATGGSPRERGIAYGTLAREEIQGTVRAYERIFKYFAKWEWQRVRGFAAEYRAPIDLYDPRFMEEIDGIAAGSEMEPDDILALNVRTEILAAAAVRDLADPDSPQVPVECTSLAITPNSGSGRTLVAQNWDWLAPTADSVIVLEVAEHEGRPAFVTVVEAGLLAKFGMNGHGLGLVTNALRTVRDAVRPGVPYHVLLRAVLECSLPGQALEALIKADRASSGNFLIAHRDGVAIDVEAKPGGPEHLHLTDPRSGILAHANHFEHPDFGERDLSLEESPDSPFRMQRILQILRNGDDLSPDRIETALGDHACHPESICAHPEAGAPEEARWQTLLGTVMDLTAGEMRLAAGAPCETPFVDVPVAGIFPTPSSAAGSS